MSVTNTAVRTPYTGNGVSTQFATTFVFLDAADVQVYVDGALKTLTTDYSVSGGDGATGTVTFVAPPATGAAIVLLRATPLTQPSTYTDEAKFPAARVTRSHDRATLQIQQMQEALGRALHLPAYDAGTGDLPALTGMAGRAVAVNATEDGFTYLGAITDVAANPMTTAGDLIVGGVAGAPARVAKGADGDRLMPTDGGSIAWVSEYLNVRAKGATGDNVTDDTAAFLDAIDTVKTRGTTHTGGGLYVPAGRYHITAPLVLPRTGTTPTTVVQIVGENMRSTILRAGATFPTNRALIEWASTAAPTWHQYLGHLTLALPAVSGVMAIHYAPTDSSSQAAIIAERLGGSCFEHLLLEGSNQYHTRLLYLQGNIATTTFRQIYGDCDLGTWAQDTVVLETDTTYPNDDGSGLNYCVIHGLYGSLRRGGFHQVFKGRMHHTAVAVLMNGNGSRSAPSVEVVNSSTVSIRQGIMEGKGSQPQWKFTTCKGVALTNCATGSPTDQGSGVGHGIELVGCEDVTWTGHFKRNGNPAFNTSGVKQLTIDANCRRLRFVDFLVGGPVSTEITNSAPAGEVEGTFYDVNGNARYFVGSPKAGVLQGWVSDAAQNVSLGTLPAFTYVSNVRVQVTEAFNSDGTDLLTVGYDADPDAYVTSLDVSTPGILSPTLGTGVGYTGTARAVEAYYTAGGSAPTAGKALVILEYRPVDTEPA